MIRALKARNKIGFVDGTIVKDKTDNSNSIKSDKVNEIMCSWILNSMSEFIFVGHVCSKFAIDI